MRVQGGCHCGSVRYEAEIDPAGVVICHCTDCQTLSGSAFRTVVPTLPGAFVLLTGHLTRYVKTAESGAQREQTFCPRCGTPIYSAADCEEPRIFALRVGAIDKRDSLIPSAQFWCRSAQRWLRDLPAIPARETQPTFDSRGRIGSD
jgi:hypothetical protein